MGFFKKIFKPFSKVLDKIVPNELKPALPYLAAFAPYMLPGGGIFASMAGRGFGSAAANLVGQLAQEGNEGEVNPLSLLLAGAQGAATAPGAGDKLRGMMSKGKPEYTNIPGGNMPGQGMGGFNTTYDTSGLTGLEKAKNFALKGGAKLSDLAGDAKDILQDPFAEGVTLEQITSAGATPFSQASGDVIYGEAVRQKKDYERSEAQRLVEEEMRQRGLDESYISSIIASMTAYGYTQAEIDEILAMQGYARGGRVGYAMGGGIMDTPEADFISMDEVVENVNQDQLMAGMGSAMKLFETPYGFDRDGFEEMIIQFKEHQDAGGDLGINNFAENFLGMVKKDTPNAPMKMAQGGMMSVLPKGMEMDYRGGGMIPMGSKEKADDVPARVSKNEFVMTADAVRAAGGGSVNKGAQRMYQLMNNLEARA
jgi:hypothetical protein